MKLIAAVSQNWGIGKDNNLLFNIPADMKFFRETTMGKTVILGRKNLESFPGGKPLKNRTNIVLTKNLDFSADDAIVCHDISDIFKLGLDTSDMFVIGGEQIYRQLLEFCDICYITKVSETVPCDKYMINLDEHPDWALKNESPEVETGGHIIKFCTYERMVQK